MRVIRLGLASALLAAIAACGGSSSSTTTDAAPRADSAVVTIDAPTGGSPDAPAGGTPDAARSDAPTGGGADARTIDAPTGGTPDAPTGGTPDAPVATPDARTIDAAPVMSLVEIIPSAASRTVTTNLRVLGFNIEDGASLVLENCDTATTYDLTAGATVSDTGREIRAMLAASPTREQGLYSVTVTNPGGASDTLVCAFLISASPPPTVSSVTPTTAWAGSPSDGRLSDAVVVITGADFQPTPSVRWTSDTRVYQSYEVHYISSTQLTAVVPAETLHMAVDNYTVTVQNPDLLEGTWGGIFAITATPPPVIDDFDPVRIEIGSCTATPVVLTGANFDPGAKAYFLAPAFFGCTGGLADPNGNKLCPMAASNISSTSITVRFTSCPGSGPWPLAVRNPDGQIGYKFSLEVTPSADGHLNQDDFVATDAKLVTARWKHAVNFAFDVFGNAFVYVTGGQNAQRNILGSVEVSQMTVFGDPGPFTITQQYGGRENPRIDNNLALPRAGHTLLVAGKTLFAVGGSPSVTDTTAIVAGTKSVERAYLLSYDEMPSVQTPTEIGNAGLPRGTWYYQVSAIGAWGESLGSREIQIRTTAGGAVQLCWAVAKESTKYNIYRSLGSDGRGGTAALIATEVAPPCFMDDGRGELAPAPGRLRGGVTAGTMSAGTYTYRVSAVVGNSETYASYATAVQLGASQAVVLNWDAVAGATEYRVFRLEGDSFRRLDAGTVTATTLTDDDLGVTEEQPLPEVRPLPAGSLSRWAQVPDAQFLTVPRDGVDGVVIRLTQQQAGDPIARLIVAGGRASNENTAAYHKTAESILVDASGNLSGTWQMEASQFGTPRAFYALLTTQDRNVTPFPPPPIEPPCPDRDGDTYVACSCAPVGVECDCDDSDPSIHPNAEEICGDGIDQDCDGEDDTCTCTIDSDGDGWVSDALCNGGDCCDIGNEDSPGCAPGTAGDINPGAIEVCGNDIDEDCDGVVADCVCTTDEDADGHLALACQGDDCCDDGSEAALGCTPGTASSIYPGAEEICGDAVDQNCDGIDPGCQCTEDADHDGHQAIACGGDDCCDSGLEAALGCDPATAADMFPGNPEICGDGIDQNCNGLDLICKAPGKLAALRPDVAGDEQVWVLAMQGAPGITRGGSTTSSSGLDTFEACQLDMSTGRLDCGATWTKQTAEVPTAGTALGNDGVLYFNFVYPFTGAKSEICQANSSQRDISNSSISRFELNDPDTVAAGQLLGGKQSASTSLSVPRSHYQLVRLMAYVFAIGGVSSSGPTDIVERHLQ